MVAAAPAGETEAQSRIDEEDIRLTTGFADIFTAILLVVGGTILGSFSGLLISAAAFVLGKPLVRTRRFAACGNVLAVGVAIGAAMPFASGSGPLGLIVAAGASALFWRVHRVPLALSLAWMAIVGFVLALSDGLSDLDHLLQKSGIGAILFSGIALFAAAMWYDSRDRLRQTRLSDVAFWLHLASAPLFVHGLFSALGSDPSMRGGVNPGVVLVTFFALTLVSLAIDRRPLLASSFIYLVTATAALLRDGWQSGQVRAQGGTEFLQAAMAPAVIGVLLLALAAAWTPLRRAILMALPEALARHLPPAARRAGPAQDERESLPEAETEPVRLVLGFNDFFVALGAAALFVGSIFIGFQLAVMMIGDPLRLPEKQLLASAEAWLPMALPALAMWLVAEYFVRVRRMAWPAITAAFAFFGTAGAAGIFAAFRYAYARQPDLLAARYQIGPPEALASDLVVQCVLIACAIPLIANLLFWWRHRVPVSFALAVLSLLPLMFLDWIILSYTGETTQAPSSTDWQLRLLVAGLAVFALAMLWDRADIARKTQRADTAFWLHLLASGLAIPALYALNLEFAGHGWPIALGFLGLVGLALIIDRRAPLVVALPFALGSIGETFGDTSQLLIGLGVVGALLALVLRWDRVRGMLIGGNPSAAT